MIATLLVIAVVIVGGIVMLSEDGYQTVDIIMAAATWAVGIGAVWMLLYYLQRLD